MTGFWIVGLFFNFYVDTAKVVDEFAVGFEIDELGQLLRAQDVLQYIHKFMIELLEQNALCLLT